MSDYNRTETSLHVCCRDILKPDLDQRNHKFSGFKMAHSRGQVWVRVETQAICSINSQFMTWPWKVWKAKMDKFYFLIKLILIILTTSPILMKIGSRFTTQLHLWNYILFYWLFTIIWFQDPDLKSRFGFGLIDQSHRYGRHQVACREPAGSYDKSTQTAICFEHKTQYLLIRAPFTRILVFWHISNIPPWFRRVKLVVIPPRFK